MFKLKLTHKKIHYTHTDLSHSHTYGNNIHWVVAQQRCTSSVLRDFSDRGQDVSEALRLVNSCWNSGCGDQRCSSFLVHVTLRHVRADYSDKHLHPPGVEAKWRRVFGSLSLRSAFAPFSRGSLSPHTPPLQCWWSQLLKSAICSIIFNYPAITASIIPFSSIVSRITCWLTAKAN